MITEDEATRLLKRADPARADHRALVVDAAGYLATLRARSSNVTVIDTEPTRTEPDHHRHRRLRIALAAAAVVAIVIGGFVLAGRNGPSEPQIPTGTTVAPPAPEAAAAEQIAREFIEGRDTWDGEKVRALVADDAVIDGETAVATADDYGIRADFERITKWRFQNPQCRTTTVGPPAEVTCSYLMSNAWTTALGVGPYTGSSFQFVIADGLIQRVTHDRDLSRFDPEAFSVWNGWLEDTHPDDFDVMYDEGGPNLTPDALALFEQRVPEFEAVHIARRFIQARNTWDAASARSLTADDAAIVDNRYTFEGVDDVHLATAEFERIAAWRHLQPQCAATVTARRPARVTCTYLMQNALSEALDEGPYRGSSFQFTVADGQIQQVTHDFDYSQYSYEVFEIFLGWLEDAHPGDVDVMFVTVDGDPVGRLTPEALALWEQRLPEFISSQSGS